MIPRDRKYIGRGLGLRAQDDPHRILGIDPGASLHEIKSAYRRKVRLLHPDSAGTGRAGIEAFEMLKEAYQDLLALHLSGKMSKQHGPEDIPRCREGMYDGTFVFITVSPWEALHGKSVEIDVYDKEEFCVHCQGSGFVAAPGSTKCQACQGKGYKRLPWGKERLRLVCTACSGTGFEAKVVCPACRGKGKVARKRRVQVRLPKGTRDGMLLCLQGQGPWSPENCARDPLYVEVRVQLPENWTIKGIDVHAPVTVDIWTALIGGDLPIPTIDGTVIHSLSSASRDGSTIRIPGRGWADAKGIRGDHVAILNVTMPKGAPMPLARSLIKWLRVLWPCKGQVIKALMWK